MARTKKTQPRRVLLQINAKTIRAFLRILADGWTAHKAAVQTGISVHRWKRERKENPHFAKRWDEAEAQGIATLEDALQRRAVKGILKPVVSQGRIVTHVREYSDSLLKLGLAARSKTYAPANPGDSTFEDTFSGAAETLQSSLSDLFARLQVAELQAGDPRVGNSPQR